MMKKEKCNKNLAEPSKQTAEQWMLAERDRLVGILPSNWSGYSAGGFFTTTPTVIITNYSHSSYNSDNKDDMERTG